MPGSVVRNDPCPDAEVAVLCLMSHDIAACVVAARPWFADAVWLAVERGGAPGAPAWCAALLSTVRSEIGASGCERLADEMDDATQAADARGYATRTACEHGSIIPHLVQTHLRRAGESCFTCSGSRDHIMVTARAWSAEEVLARLRGALPPLAEAAVEIGVIRMPDHRDALARAMPVASAARDDGDSLARAATAALRAALPMHRPLLEAVLAPVLAPKNIPHAQQPLAWPLR